MRPRALTLLLAGLTLALACAGDPGAAPLELGARAPVNASVQFVNVEGGCWTLAVGQVSYLPLNLPEQFRRDGLQVQVRLVRRDDYGSICMIGPVVEILSIRAR